MGPEGENPSAAIEAAFAALAGNAMADLPLNNPALQVEAVGFRPWAGLWVGVLVSPWTISLMLLPSHCPVFRRLTGDGIQHWDFPSGRYAFRGGRLDTFGPYQTCSLFSPPSEFADQAAARAVAEAVMDALFRGETSAHSRRDFLRGNFGRSG